MSPRKILIIVTGLVVIGIVTVVILIKIKPNFRQGNKQLVEKTELPGRIITVDEKVKELYPDATNDEQLLLTRGHRLFEIATDTAMLTLAEKVAGVGGKIEINDCRVNPIILKVQQGGEFKFRNNEDRIEFITLGDKEYEIASNGGELKIKANFKRPFGLFSYRCGRPNSGIHGLIYILKSETLKD